MKYKVQEAAQVVDAWHWVVKGMGYIQMPQPEWVDKALTSWPKQGSLSVEMAHPDGPCMHLVVFGGRVTVHPGDWLVRLSNGNIVRVAASTFMDIFEEDRRITTVPIPGQTTIDAALEAAQEALGDVRHDLPGRRDKV